MATLPLRGHAPDLDPSMPGVFSYCSGVEPTKRGWRVQRVLTALYATSGAAFASGSYILDGLISELPDGTEVAHAAIFDFNANKTKLYANVSTTLTDKSRAANYTKSTGTNFTNFSFCQFGNYTLATNLVDILQIRDASTTNVFADSSATGIPKAKICVSWGPPTSLRVMLLHYNDGTDYPDGWWSSHLGGPTASWVTDIATGAANGRLNGAGPIRCAVAYGDDIIAFSDRQMWFGQVSIPYIVKWTKVASDVGCCGPYAAKVINGVLYWVGLQGVFAWAGQGIQKLDIPIQRNVSALIVAASTLARNVHVTGDATTRRLLIGIRTGVFGANAQIQPWFSVNLDTNQVGVLTTSRDSGATIVSQAYDRNKAAYIASGEAVIAFEGTTKYQATIAESIGFGLSHLGNNIGEHKNVMVIPRFLTAPDSYRMTDYYGPHSADVTHAATALDVTSSQEWRANIIMTARWHAPRLFFATATNDMEVAEVDLVDVQTGRK